MKLFTIALAFALVAACFSDRVSATVPDPSRIGAYYLDANCGSGVGHDLLAGQKSPITFNEYQGAKSARMDSKGFTIFQDTACTQGARSQGAGGCAHLDGKLIRCLKY